jgi:hypothetical protein
MKNQNKQLTILKQGYKMTLDQQTFLQMVLMILSFILMFTILRIWYNMRNWEDIGKMAKGNKIAISKLKGDLKKGLYSGVVQGGGSSAGSGPLPDTLEGAMKEFGLDPKLLKNPLIRPTAEKIYQQMKNREEGGEEEDANWGY